MNRLAKLNHSTVLVGDASTLALAAAAVTREYLLLQNDSALDQYLAIDDGDAALHAGIVLKAAGGSYEPLIVPQGAIQAITSADAGAHATGTLTFTGNVADGETVTIGDEVYEFDTNTGVTPGNIRVALGAGGVAPANAVTQLVAAILANTAYDLTAVDGALDTVVVTALRSGVWANALDTLEACANASWGAAKLAGGTDNTNYLLVSWR
ncbi:MAG: hypothetical protein ACYDCO_01765 [Armatimonadota bacterium]